MTVGVPEVRTLSHAPNLRARLVLVSKGFMDEPTFRQAAQRQLNDLKIVRELLNRVCHHSTISVSRPLP